jgi:hypothetical protein
MGRFADSEVHAGSPKGDAVYALKRYMSSMEFLVGNQSQMDGRTIQIGRAFSQTYSHNIAISLKTPKNPPPVSKTAGRLP